MSRIANSLIWTALVFVGLWYCPYGMPHHPVGAYITFAVLVFAAAWLISVAIWAMRTGEELCRQFVTVPIVALDGHVYGLTNDGPYDIATYDDDQL